MTEVFLLTAVYSIISQRELLLVPGQLSSPDKIQAVIKGDDESQVAAPLHAQETQNSSSWIFPGFYNSGDIPGPVTPNPREGGPGQAALCHLPKRAS